jgi:4-carboxymuconolactone decarboxylase
VKEIVYQVVPYVGMAKVFDFLHATKDVPSDSGVELPLPGQSTATAETPALLGRAVQGQIVGADQVDRMYASAPADEQHIQRLLSANCFGDHLTRSGIDVATRELLTFAMLVSLGGCEPQSPGTWRPTATSATTAPGCSPSSPSSSRSSVTHAPSTGCGCSTTSSLPRLEGDLDDCTNLADHRRE